MMASRNGDLYIVRTLLDGGADVNAKDKVRNQMMMMILLTILIMMMMMMMMIVVINDEDGVDCI